jgi:HD-like signal output (HDOD) protein
MTTFTIDKLLDAIQASKGVPANERSVVSVLGALDNNSGGAGKQEVVNHIIEDFALTQRVLKLANSSMYSPFGSGAASVSAALNVLDSEALMHLVLSTNLAPEEEVLADKNLSRTLLASELARSALAERAEDASIATLMYEIGRLMTGKYMRKETEEIDVLISQGLDVQRASTQVLGMSFQEIGVELATRWNLPNYILSSIDGTGDPALVGVSRFSSSASGLIQEGRMEEVSQLLLDLDVPSVDKKRLTLLVNKKFDESRFANSMPAGGAKATPLGALRNTMVQEKKRIIDDMAQSLLPPLVESLGAAHCLLFMLTRTGEFRIRAGYGDNMEALMAKLRVSADFSPTAFHLAIRNKTEIAIDDISRLKASALPTNYRELLPNTRKLVIIPIAKTGTSGLLYADWDTAKEMTQPMIAAMRNLRDMFVPFFP